MCISIGMRMKIRMRIKINEKENDNENQIETHVLKILTKKPPIPSSRNVCHLAAKSHNNYTSLKLQNTLKLV